MTTFLRRGVGVAALALIVPMVPLATSMAGADAPDTLITAAADSGDIDTPDNSVRTRSVSLDLDLADVRRGDRFTVPLFGDLEAAVTVREVDNTSEYRHIYGVLDDGGSFDATVVGSEARASLTTAAGSFEIIDDGSHALLSEHVDIENTQPTDARTPEAHEEHDHAETTTGSGEETLPSESAARKAPKSSSIVTSSLPGATGDGPGVLDLLVAYTPESLARAGGEAQMQAIIANTVARTNRSFTNSGIGSQARVVGTMVTAQAQGSISHDLELDAVTDAGDGRYEDVHAMRDAVRADQVTLLIANTTQYCGLGWLRGKADRAFTTVDVSCAANGLTFGHELGHNLGADHDASAGSPPFGLIPDARGYINPARTWRTVMAYPTGCADPYSCTWLEHFSNPNVFYGGEPTGTAGANNARVIVEYAPVLAAHRQSQMFPAQVAISGAARYKSTARAISGAWLPAETGLSVQWYLNGVAVPGATGETFSPSRGQIGQSLHAVITGTAANLTSVQAATPAFVVAPGLLKVKRPKVRGKARVGAVLRASVKVGKSPKKKVRINWERNGKKIKGAKGPRYRVKAKDRGKKITAVVTVKAKGYETAKRASKKLKVRRR